MVNKAIFRTVPIQLAEVISNFVEIIRIGTFQHADPKVGKVEITKEMLASFKKNFDAKVRRIDIAIDFAHKSDLEAAAWIKKLELKNDGAELWAEVDWSASGKKAVEGKDFRYLSADIHPDYQDNETLKTYGPTLLGAALTNRPVIKDMEPVVQLSESTGKDGNTMDPKDQEIADLKAKIAALEKGQGGNTADMAKFKEMEAKLTAALQECDTLKKEKANTAMSNTFSELVKAGKACEAQREAYMSGDMVKFSELAQPLNMKPKGEDDKGDKKGGEKSGDEKILELAEKMIADKKASNLGDAISMVLAEEKSKQEKKN